MIAIIIGLLLALAVAAWIVARLAAMIHSQNEVIIAQHNTIRQLETDIHLHEQRIAWHVSNSAQLAEQLGRLESAVAHYITALPKCNQRSALVAKREIIWN